MVFYVAYLSSNKHGSRLNNTGQDKLILSEEVAYIANGSTVHTELSIIVTKSAKTNHVSASYT